MPPSCRPQLLSPRGQEPTSGRCSLITSCSRLYPIDILRNFSNFPHVFGNHEVRLATCKLNLNRSRNVDESVQGLALGPACGGRQTLFEFPVMPSGQVYNGGPPGTDRVVYTAGNTFCGTDSCLPHHKCSASGTQNALAPLAGCITHKNAPRRNGFIACAFVV